MVWGEIFGKGNFLAEDSLGNKIDSLIAANDSLVPQHQMEEINKSVTTIKLQPEKNINKGLTESDIESLRNIAALCPLEYGPGYIQPAPY